MNATISRSANRWSISLHPDEMDAIPPVPDLWFEADRPLEIDPYRLSLLAYIVSGDLVGNVFEITGCNIPAHVASAIQGEFAGHELLVQGIDNSARRIRCEPMYGWFAYEENVAASLGSRLADMGGIVARKTELGFDFLDQSHKCVLSVRTNLAFHAAMCSADPLATIRAALYLLIYDILKPCCLYLPLTQRGRHYASLLQEVGAEIVQ